MRLWSRTWGSTVTASRRSAVGPASAREEIDAPGRIVTPGFVDVHTHYDGQITWENRLAPSSGHGVTTVVMGNCGVGFAPVRPATTSCVIKLMEGVEDIPDVVMAEGVPFNWESFPDYLDALDKRQSDIDFCAQLPHSPAARLRHGRARADLEPPTEADLAEMRRLTTRGDRGRRLGVTQLAQPRPSLPHRHARAVGLDRGAGAARAGRGPARRRHRAFPDRAELRRSSRAPSSTCCESIAGEAGPPALLHLHGDAAPAGRLAGICRGTHRPMTTGSRSAARSSRARSAGCWASSCRSTPSRSTPASGRSPTCRSPKRSRRCATPSCARSCFPEEPEDPTASSNSSSPRRTCCSGSAIRRTTIHSADESIGRDGAGDRDATQGDASTTSCSRKDGHEILYRPMGNIDQTPRIRRLGTARWSTAITR